MKWILFFLLIPFGSSSQTVHVKDEKIYYEGLIKINSSETNPEKALEEAMKYGVKTISVRIKGPGAARESAVRAVSASVNRHQLAVISIKDVTPVPHNGCRKPKRRRV